MELYKLLLSKSFRKGLAKYIDIHAPELIECDINNHVHERVKILEHNNQFSHHFELILGGNKGGSYQSLWVITEESKLDDIYQVSQNAFWGYKGRLTPDMGWKYPNIGDKVKNLIIVYMRKEKLLKIKELNVS